MNRFLGSLLLIFSICAQANDNLSLSVSPSQNSFVVKLKANPTTGFQWNVIQFDKQLMSLTSSQYQKPQSNLIGAGGQMLFTFTLNKLKNRPEKTNIVFKYARSWEPDGSTIKKVTIHFTPTN